MPDEITGDRVEALIGRDDVIVALEGLFETAVTSGSLSARGLELGGDPLVQVGRVTTPSFSPRAS